MLLALDLGTKTGWAKTNGVDIISGMKNLKADRFSGGGMRFLIFEKWLNEQGNITQVVYEEVRRHIGTDAAHVYGGMWATLTKWCEQNNIPYQGVAVGTIKKHWTGKGNASKDAMIHEGHKRGFDHVKDDNQMDAIALLDYWTKHGTFNQ